jgi:NADH-quinone oxidoreductase subunit M
MKTVPDLSHSEMAAAGVLSFGILAIGFYPVPALALISASVTRLAQLFGA